MKENLVTPGVEGPFLRSEEPRVEWGPNVSKWTREGVSTTLVPLSVGLVRQDFRGPVRGPRTSSDPKPSSPAS